MSWTQEVNPINSIALSALVAAVPIFFIFWALIIKKMKGYMASLITAVVAILVAVIVYGMPVKLALLSTLHGALYGFFPICWIIIGAVFLYNVTVKSGQFEIIKSFMTSITNDRRLQALLIAFSFGSFLEGAAGMGAPVAITSVEQRPAKGRTTFIINVHHNRKNAGDMLYDYFSLYKCDPAAGGIVKTTDKNVVYVGYVYLSNLDITMLCLPDQIIRLDASGNGQITCSVDFPQGMALNGAYRAPLEIELWYGYSKTIVRNVLIKRI